MAATDHLRWGVIGTGGIAARFTEDLDGAVVAVGSRTAESAERFGRQFGVERRHPGYQELVDDPRVEAVYVATPHPGHRPAALLAIAAGKPVLVEKPFMMDAAEAREVAGAARAAGVFCMEAMWSRFLPHLVRLRELLAGGAIGEVRTLIADHGQRFVPDRSHRLFAPELGGGALLDLGVYPVSFASMVLGPPSTLTAASTPAFTGVDAQTSAVLRYAGGAHAVLTCTLESRTATRASIAGTDGRIDIDPVWYAPARLTVSRFDGGGESYDGVTAAGEGPGKGLRFEAAEVARCVRDGRTQSPVMPLDESVQIMQTLDDIARAARE